MRCSTGWPRSWEWRKVTTPYLTSREQVRQALRRAGWRIDEERPDRIEASDGERYGVAVFFEDGQPISIEYGDGERDLQYQEDWTPGARHPRARRGRATVPRSERRVE